MTLATRPPVTQLSFEDALAELEGIVRDLEGGKASLEDSISAYERGVQLRRHCETKLKDAQMLIEKIGLGPDGAPQTQAFNPET